MKKSKEKKLWAVVVDYVDLNNPWSRVDEFDPNQSIDGNNDAVLSAFLFASKEKALKCVAKAVADGYDVKLFFGTPRTFEVTAFLVDGSK